MLKSNQLYKSNEIEVKEIDLPELDMKYPFISSEDSVVILPFRLKAGEESEQEAEFLVRRDWVPCWGIYEDDLKQPYFLMTSISDKIPKGMTPTNAAIKILQDQSGFQVNGQQVIELGSVFVEKSYSGMCYVLSVDLTSAERGEPSQENKLKNKGEAFWTDEKQMIAIGADPLLHVTFSKLLQLWT
jgi:hypothetical protein